MKVIGYNGNSSLSGSLSNQTREYKEIKTPCQSPLDVPSLLSFSTCWFSVWITQNGEAFAVGPNDGGRICSKMRQEEFEKDTKIEFTNKNGQPCKFISAVCGDFYTLYQVAGETSSGPSQLVYAYLNKGTTFLNIGKRSPLSLFGGCYTAAVIDTEGGVIIITKSVLNSPTSELESLSLPDGDRAVKVACGQYVIIVLGESGRVFEYWLYATNNSFSEVRELSGIKIKEISGIENHFFAITEDGKVFGRGNNGNNRLGMPSDKDYVKVFKVVESLNKYHIVEAFAGLAESLFRTSEGEFLGCGSNSKRKLMLEDADRSNVYPPVKTTITRDATFCILGNCKTVVFFGVDPPPNTPNRKVSQFSKTINPPKISKKVSEMTKEELQEMFELIQKENTSLKEENASLKEESTSLKEESTSLKEESTSLKEESTSLKEENTSLKEESTSLKEESTSLKEENASLKEESTSLKEELKQSKKRISELEQEVKELKKKSTPEGKESKKGCGLEIFDAETLDKLERIKSLGRGATSEVFEVVRERFALKVYNLELLTDNEEEEEKIVINMKNAQRFILEYESIDQLDHKNIIKAFGVCFGDSTHPPAILLEHCASNLKKKIKKLTDSERISAIVDISSAMKEVHSIGLIHRDLKLENILVDENNNIKVSDFGHGTLITLDTETMSRTQMVGTLEYMAPELLQERTDYDEKVDVYAFGVVVFLILTKGKFPKISLCDVGAGKKADIPSSISSFSRDLINKCWSYKSSDRPSFAEICDTLKGNESKLI